MDGFGVVLFVLGGVAALGYWIYDHQRKSRRREQIAKRAFQRGLGFAHRDVHSTLGLGFALFRRGDERAVENVVSGVLDGQPVRTFDYWYAEVSTDNRGHRHKRYYRFTCACLPVDGAAWPHLRIERETLKTRARDRLGFRDIQFESDEFNRRFQITCDDRRFAHTLIDARMMQWLLATEGRFEFEVRGRHLLCATSQIRDPDQFFLPHQVVSQMRERIPAIAWELYPGPTTGDSPASGRLPGRDLPAG